MLSTFSAFHAVAPLNGLTVVCCQVFWVLPSPSVQPLGPFSMSSSNTVSVASSIGQSPGAGCVPKLKTLLSGASPQKLVGVTRQKYSVEVESGVAGWNDVPSTVSLITMLLND